MTKNNINKKEEDIDKLLKRKIEESDALRKMLKKLNFNKVKSKKIEL